MALDKDFMWGVAASAYQIEGAESEGGRGESIWDSKYTEGHVLGNMNGKYACDHYHHYKEDIALMKKFGIKHYRLSISWPRILPNGTGELNPEGVKFYQDLVDELLEAGITPWVNLFHWDLPRKLYEKGGYLNPEISDWYAEYATRVVEMFGDKVYQYILFNEPECVAEDGHFLGNHAPFLKLSRKETFRVAHNLLLCLGKAEKAMRKTAKHKLSIGLVPCSTPAMPTKPEDKEAALKYNFSPNGSFYDACFFPDAVIKGEFSPEYKEWFDKYDYHPSAEDMKIIKCQLDYFAINLYRGYYVESTPEGVKRLPVRQIDNYTSMNWIVTPEAMGYVVKYYYDRYKLPIIISENGVGITEWKTLNGDVPDDMRIDYIKRHLIEMKKIAEEYPVKGYFYWSFLDNFEWQFGFAKRFGLVYVDYSTMERTPKKSAYWYKKVIESNGEDLD